MDVDVGMRVGVFVTVTVTGLVGVVRLVMVGFGVCEGFTEAVGETFAVGVVLADRYSCACLSISSVTAVSGKPNNSCQLSTAFFGLLRFS